MKRASLLEAIMPTHHKLLKSSRTAKADARCPMPEAAYKAGTVSRKERVGFVSTALMVHLKDCNYPAALETCEQLNRELRLLIVESGVDEAGVVHRD